MCSGRRAIHCRHASKRAAALAPYLLMVPHLHRQTAGRRQAVQGPHHTLVPVRARGGAWQAALPPAGRLGGPVHRARSELCRHRLHDQHLLWRRPALRRRLHRLRGGAVRRGRVWSDHSDGDVPHQGCARLLPRGPRRGLLSHDHTRRRRARRYVGRGRRRRVEVGATCAPVERVGGGRVGRVQLL